jgi:hypothetical protein
MGPETYPLLTLFRRLRDRGLELGVDEYVVALRALQAGYGVDSRTALARLCRTLWVKSESELRVFNALFAELFPTGQRVESPPPLETAPIDIPRQDDEPSPPAEGPLDDRPARQETPTPISSQQTTADDRGVEEPAAIVRAARHREMPPANLGQARFRFRTDYLPVTRRQMKQSWRHLRRMVRQGASVEIDVTETVDRAARQGVLLEPVLVPRQVNRARLVFLLDWGGSMVPFHGLSRQLVDTARRGGRLDTSDVYYFQGCPINYLYRDPQRMEAELIAAALREMGHQAMVLIVSDGGATQSGMDDGRVVRTRAFVERLRRSVRRYAWLNPMPNHRWQGTTASEIARLLPMFELSRQGLDTAIDVLRGKYVQSERLYPWMT